MTSISSSYLSNITHPNPTYFFPPFVLLYHIHTSVFCTTTVSPERFTPTMQKLYLAIPLYLVITLIIWFVKPPITYNPQRKQFRPFGTGKHATLLPMWLLSMLIAVLAYLAASMANVWGWFSTHPSTQATQELNPSELETIQQSSPVQMWSVEPLPSANSVETGDVGGAAIPELPDMQEMPPDISFADNTNKAIPHTIAETPLHETMMYRRRTMAGGGYRPTTTQSARTRTQSRTSHTAQQPRYQARHQARHQPRQQPHQPRRQTAHSSTRSSINTRLTRHPDAKRQRAAIRDSRVWKQVMQ